MPKPVTIRTSGKAKVVTIPRHILSALMWRKGDVLLLSVRGDALLLQRMLPPNPLSSVPAEQSVGVGK